MCRLGAIPKTEKTQAQENQDRRAASLSALKLICDSTVFAPHLEALLAAQDARGNTPFMAAVACRAYPAALVLFEAAQMVAVESSNDEQTQKKTLMSMVFPPGSPADSSPLHVICCNDTCSFTWTGAEHINQDIFECRTCGLTDSLCCCTECARVCHKGHDCKLKRTSPTAYCDCWEKCQCRALVGGHQGHRYDVLCKLIKETPDLVRIPNGRGENILLFIVQTVGRQMVEQRQYRPSRARKSVSRKAPSATAGGSSGGAAASAGADMDGDMPEHDLEPPRFSRRALERLLYDWSAVKAMIATGQKEDGSSNQPSGPVYEDQAFLGSQSGTALLDKFTHALLVKCSAEMLDTLLTTLIRQLQGSDKAEARLVAKRFVRSVTRVFVVFNVEMSPGQSKKKALQSTTPLQRCKRVFQGLINIAVEELCEIANALLSPVRLGVARPTAPFTLSSSSNSDVQAIEDLFAVEPVVASAAASSSSSAAAARLRGGNNNSNSGGGGAVDGSNALRSSGRQQGASAQAGGSGAGSGSMAPGASTSARQSQQQRDQQSAERSGAANNEAAESQDADDNDDADVADDQEFGMDVEGGDGGDDGAGAQGGAGGGQEANPDGDDQHSDMDLDLLVESESDSDGEGDGTNNESQDIQGGGGGGANDDALFSDDDSGGESAHLEDEESDAGETDEQDGEDFNFGGEEQLERRVTTGNSGSAADRSNLAPQSMQWAVRVRTKTSNRASNGGFIYIDPSSLRRTAAAGAAAVAAPAVNDPMTMSTTASALARAFGIVVRQIADLLTMLQDYSTLAPALPRTLDISFQESMQLQLLIEYQMKPNWDWLMTVMDSTEAQLRFGSALSNLATESGANPNAFLATQRGGRAPGDRSLPSRSGGGASSSTEQVTNRRDFLNYALSLMRAHNSEHSDSLPVLDVAAMKHIAYVFDALIYYMRTGSDAADAAAGGDTPRETYNLEGFVPYDENDNDDDVAEELSAAAAVGASNAGQQSSASAAAGGVQQMDVDDEDTNQSAIAAAAAAAAATRGRKHPFFQRSESTLCLGCPPPDPFQTPMQEALPLADQPQLLQPNARREDLFGIPKQPVGSAAGSSSSAAAANASTPPLSVLPARLGLSVRATESPASVGGAGQSGAATGPTGNSASGPTPGTSTPAQQASGGNFPLSTAPFQAGPSSEANFDRVVLQAQRSGNASPTAATCDTASVRSLDTTANNPDELENEPQDLSMGGAMSSASSVSEMNAGADDPVPSTSKGQGLFTSPKKAFMMREAAANRESRDEGASTSAAATSTPAKSSSSLSAPEVLIVPTDSSKQSGAPGDSADASNVSVTATTGGEVSANVTIETTTTTQSAPAAAASASAAAASAATQPSTSALAAAKHRQQLQLASGLGQSVPHDILLGRWRLALDLFGRVFVDDVGLEPGSIISELGGFPVKEAKFRREMEKLRNSRTADLTIQKIERERGQLIVQAFKELNAHYSQNQRRSSSSQPPLVVNRVKVTFLNEPGEGSGVARSFYTALAEAVLSNQKLPNLESAQVGSSKTNMQFNLIQRLKGNSSRSLERRAHKSSSRSSARDASRSLNYSARSFYMNRKLLLVRQ